VAVQQVSSPGRSYFYSGETVSFSGAGSYDQDESGASITYYEWYVDGAYKAGGSSKSTWTTSFSVAGGQTTVSIKLRVRDDENNWSEQTLSYTVKAKPGRVYYLKDHLGSVRTSVDENGHVIGYDDYYPFGLVMPGRSSNSGNPNDNYKYIGEEWDDEAGLNLMHLNARAMDPVTGRFMQIDRYHDKYPFASPYSYTLNNPVNFTDVTGDTLDVSALDDKTQNWLVGQLNELTGLDLRVENGLLLHNEDSEVRTEGTSETARNDLLSAISDSRFVYTRTIDESRSTDGSHFDDESSTIFLNLGDINYSEKNSVNVSSLTMGMGMTFLHELNHTPIVPNQTQDDYHLGLGRTVFHMNQIRRELGVNRFGQRTSYGHTEDNRGLFIPFDHNDGIRKVYRRTLGQKIINQKRN